MKNLIYLLALLFLLKISGREAYSAGERFEIYDLRCEYKTNPIGIDEPHPRLSWKINPDSKIAHQNAYQIRAAKTESDLRKTNKLIWDTEKVNSDKSVQVYYAGSQPESGERIYWQVRIWDQNGKLTKWSEPAFFEMGLLKTEDWKAKWITPLLPGDSLRPGPAPYLRNEFKIDKPVSKARAYVTSLGLYEFRLNGEKVGDELFTPGWTSYETRLPYQTYDITSYLKEGMNAVGAILGDGWYRGYVSIPENKRIYKKKLALLLQMEIVFKDGSRVTIMTDDEWKSSYGPILMSDIYDGEKYDARKAFNGWDKAGFDEKNWYGTTFYAEGKDHLIAPDDPPVRRIMEIKPVDIIYTPEGDTVLDMGQNMVGWMRINIKAERGQTISLKHAEVLDKNGNLYIKNLRGADQLVSYTFNGEDTEEKYEPHFSFQGFRYVAVSGLNTEPSKDMFTGVVIHSDMDLTGSFECSDTLVNQLQQNIQWGQRGNFLEVPTDCPQRDERWGWTGDAQVFAQTGCFNFNAAGFYSKWLKDLAAHQREDGAIPHLIPDVVNHYGSAAWGDAGVIVPWIVYLNYSDVKVLETQFNSMKKWVDFMNKAAGEDHIWQRGTYFGDWLAFSTDKPYYPGATTYRDLIATAYLARSSRIVANTAKILGKEEEAVKYQMLYDLVRKSFQDEYITPNGRITSNTQTAYLLGLAFDLFPDEKESSAVEYLLKRIGRYGHLTTGFVGTPLLCPVLSEYGQTDTAYYLLMRTEYPSWLYPITMGATTIWERWDGIKPDGTFQDPAMNSFNHYAYGAIGEWLYRFVAGIEIDEEHPGYKHIIFQPHPEDELSYAKASYESMYGLISSSWKLEKGKLNYEIIIPPNTTASVKLPDARDKEVVVNGSKLSRDRFEIREEDDELIIQVKPGSYAFSYPYKSKKEDGED